MRALRQSQHEEASEDWWHRRQGWQQPQKVQQLQHEQPQHEQPQRQRSKSARKLPAAPKAGASQDRSRSPIPRLKRYQNDDSQHSRERPKRSNLPKSALRQRHVGILKKPAMRGAWFAYRFIRCDELYEIYGRDVFMHKSGNEEAMEYPEGSSVSFTIFEREDKHQAENVRLIAPG